MPNQHRVARLAATIRTHRFAVAATLILLLLVVGAGCHQTMPLPVLASGEGRRAVFTLEAEGSSPFLALNHPEAGTATQVSIASTDSGVSTSLGAVQNQAGRSTDFTTKTPLATTLYLDLDQPVTGKIFWSNTATQTAAVSGKAVDAAQIRVDVWMNDKRVGGDILTYNAVATSAQQPWIVFPVNFRAEVSKLEAGANLRVTITRLSGLTDMLVSTGGEGRQSHVEFRYFERDPLSGALYLEAGRLYTGTPEPSPTSEDLLARVEAFRAAGGDARAGPGLVFVPPVTPQEDSDSPVVAFGFGIVGLLGLAVGVSPPLRRKGVSLLLLAILLSVGLAGCIGSSGGPADGAQVPHSGGPRVNETRVDREDLRVAGHGAVSGNVTNEFGLPVHNAHVAILQTAHFTKTDKQGRFNFPNVTAGVYILRIDADKFSPLERTITVEIGKQTHLDIALQPPSTLTSNQKAHNHDYWTGQTRIALPEFSVMPTSASYVVDGNSVTGPTNNWYCTGFYDVARNNIKAKHADRTNSCETNAVLPVTARILPGTGTVEVFLSWSVSGYMPKELGLRILTAGNTSADQIYVPRGPNEPFRIQIFPNEADPGHAQLSVWKFFITPPVTDGYHPFGPAVYGGGKVNVKIILHKSVVPMEPAHRDFWGEATTLPLPLASATLTGSYNQDRPSTTYTGWTITKPALIPPGTMEVRGTLRWTHSYLDAAPASQTQWKLAFISANLAKLDENWRPADQMIANGTNKYDFVIKVAPGMADQFYQALSYWVFQPDDGRNDSANTAYGSTWTLTAYAVRDPTWKDVN